MKTNEPVLKAEELFFTYNGDKHALNGVNLEIYEGERIAVLGSNGAGKSTFFLNINGVLTPEKGSIYYRGTKISKKTLNDLRKNVGIVFQDADNQIIASTVMAEVSFGPMNLKLPKEEVIRRVDMALDYMNISEYRERPRVAARKKESALRILLLWNRKSLFLMNLPHPLTHKMPPC